MTLNSIKINLKNEFDKLKANAFLAFYILFGLVLIINFWVLVTSVKPVISAKNYKVKLEIAKGVSLKTEDYAFALKRIKDGKNYFPPAPLFQNPFGKE